MDKYWDDIVFVVSCDLVIAKFILKNSKYEICENRLKVFLNGPDMFKKCGNYIEKILNNYYGKDIRVEFLKPIESDYDREDYIKRKEKEEYEVIANTVKNIENDKKAGEVEIKDCIETE